MNQTNSNMKITKQQLIVAFIVGALITGLMIGQAVQLEKIHLLEYKTIQSQYKIEELEGKVEDLKESIHQTDLYLAQRSKTNKW